MIGLKENVIIGKLIPAGTGMKRYSQVKLDTDEQLAAQAAEEEELSELEDVELEISEISEEPAVQTEPEEILTEE